MSEDYSDFFNGKAPDEPKDEAWKGVPPPESGWKPVNFVPSQSEPPEPEQIPVWVKIVKVDGEVLPIQVFMREPPEPSFGYVFSTAGKWFAASSIYGLIGWIIGSILYAIFK